jgi:hypothetical protein
VIAAVSSSSGIVASLRLRVLRLLRSVAPLTPRADMRMCLVHCHSVLPKMTGSAMTFTNVCELRR